MEFLLTLILSRSWEDLATITAFSFSFLLLAFIFVFFETVSHYIPQASLEVTCNPHWS